MKRTMRVLAVLIGFHLGSGCGDSPTASEEWLAEACEDLSAEARKKHSMCDG